MRILMRADASLRIGGGHVARCLTLAEALARRGAEAVFVMRAHEGHRAEAAQARGFAVRLLPQAPEPFAASEEGPPHAHWLEADWRRDLEETLAACPEGADWLAVDHYALDRRWEQGARALGARILVLDDLADRPHDCDLLLDVNLGRRAEDYAGLLPEAAELLIGPDWALLRPEFAALRAESLARRRASPDLRRLLISAGSVDAENVAGRTLAALERAGERDLAVDVVLGAQAPWIEDLRRRIAAAPFPARLHVETREMARLMVEADLAVGAAGGSAWERCCLGLPTLLAVVAENQRSGAAALAAAGAVLPLGEGAEIDARLPEALAAAREPARLAALSAAAARVTEGLGAERVASLMTGDEKMSEETGRVRPMNEADLAQALVWRNHESVRGFMLTTHEISPEEHRAWFARVSQDPARLLLIFERDGEALGFAQFSRHGDPEVADWGCYAAPGAPRGTGRTIGRAALRYAFDEFGLRKICGQALDHNAASIRFQTALGFQPEGLLRAQHRAGEFLRDLHLFGLLKSEWLALEERS